MDLESAVNKTKTNFKISERKDEETTVIDTYGQIFHPSNLESLSKDDFKSFLQIKNNKHWNGIHRRSNDITSDMARLKEALNILLDESKGIGERFNILIPKNKPKYIKYLGQAILTPILLVVYPKKYGVYNNVTLQALEKLDIKPEFKRGTSFGKEYVKINEILLKISKDYNLSLFELDEVWWNVLDEQNPPDIENIGYVITQIGNEIEAMNKNKLETITKEDKLYKLTNEDFPNALESTIKDFKFSNDYLFKGSAGQGNRTLCPWGVILDPRISTTPQEGFYPAYLFDNDGKRVYLSLNQGATSVEKSNNNSIPQTKKALEEQANNFRNILKINGPLLFNKYSTDNIRLANPKMCEYYEKGNICSITYNIEKLPLDDQIRNDLEGILKLFNILIANEGYPETFDSFQGYTLDLGYFFKPELIENFLLSLKVKPFVILTGNSGTGKTKIAQLFADYLKIISSCQQKLVPVGANWTENRHLLGFYNIITKDYQKTAALNLIRGANDNDKSPYFLVLDEMNLSHVERYFADFLSAMESEDPIPLHSNEDTDIPPELEIPNNLLVIGTVNVDETTYMFSPKVLDRANTIEFETYPANDYMLSDYNNEKMEGNVKYLENPLSDPETRKFTVNDLKERLKDVKIDANDYLWDVLADEIYSFQEVLGKAGFDFGFRVINEILRFMYVAWVYEGKQEVWDNWMRYFDAQIKQKMLPKLHGSQRVLEEVLRELFELCYWDAVDSAPRYFENLETDPAVKYKSSVLKLQEMDKVLNEQRYVSFIN